MPTVPQNLKTVLTTTDEIHIAWDAATDNKAVSGYRVFRDGIEIKMAPGTSYSDKDLLPGTEYTYSVTALDAAGNESSQSEPLNASTKAEDDLPSVPVTTGPVPTSATENVYYVDQNPKFVDGNAGNYHLASGSPAIDAGATLDNQNLQKDYDGDKRPSGSAFDIGIDER